MSHIIGKFNVLSFEVCSYSTIIVNLFLIFKYLKSSLHFSKKNLFFFLNVECKKPLAHNCTFTRLLCRININFSIDIQQLYIVKM